MTDLIDPMTEAALAGLREPLPPAWPMPRWWPSAWPTTTPSSSRPSARCAWPGTVAAYPRSRATPTTPTFEARFLARTGRRARRVAALPADLARRIEKRLAGDRHNRIDLDLRGSTPFEQAVWMKALEIPHGEVRPYGWIAAEIGRPKAVRAVGTALGHNPVPLIVPCHRVVRSDGTIGQYSLGGPDNKRTILAEEGADPDELEALARAGVRYFGSDTTRIYCMPTCRDARRVTERHLVHFASARAATAAGYRPCRHCRPLGAAVA